MLHKGSMCFYKSGSGSAGAHGILLWPRKLRISPEFGWNTETRDNFDQLKAKMRNNYQSNATASIPCTVVCMGKVIDFVWGRTEWKTLVEQGSRGVSGTKHWCWGNISDELRSAFSFLPENKQATGQSFMISWSFALWCLCSFVFSCSWRNIYCLLSICFNCSLCSVAGPCWHSCCIFEGPSSQRSWRDDPWSQEIRCELTIDSMNMRGLWIVSFVFIADD